MKNLIKILSFSLKNVSKVLAWGMTSLLFLSALFSLPFPIIQKYLINALIDSESYKISYLLAFLILSVIIKVIFTIGSNYISSVFEENAAMNIRKNTIYKLLDIHMEQIKKQDTDYLHNRIKEDASTVSRFTKNVCGSIFSGLFLFVFSLIYIFLYSPFLILVMIAVLFVFIVVYFLCNVRMAKSAKIFKEIQNKSYSTFNESLANISTVKLNNWKNIEYSKHTKTIREYISSFRKILGFSTLFVTIASSLQIFFTLAMLVVGSFMILNNTLTVGDLLTLVSFSSLVISPVVSIIEILSIYPEANVSFTRIMELLSLPSEKSGETVISSIDSITLNSISYGYDENILVQNLNYNFEKGKIYLVYGANGSGKSTLFKILSRLYSQYDGKIIINKKYSLDEISIESLYHRLTYIEQESHLFCGTIRHNIFYDDSNNRDRILPQFMNNFANSLSILPNGLDTHIVGNASTNISGGEKQKTAIIRDIVKTKDVILLDEPFASLDIESIEELFTILNEMKREHIILLVTHSREYDEYADEIVVIKEM